MPDKMLPAFVGHQLQFVFTCESGMAANEFPMHAVNLLFAPLQHVIGRQLQRCVDILGGTKLVAEICADGKDIVALIGIILCQDKFAVARIGELPAQNANESILTAEDLLEDLKNLARPLRVKS